MTWFVVDHGKVKVVEAFWRSCRLGELQYVHEHEPEKISPAWTVTNNASMSQRRVLVITEIFYWHGLLLADPTADESRRVSIASWTAAGNSEKKS